MSGNPLFDEPPERTAYTDEVYAVLGRALTYATKFERDSKMLAKLFNLKSNPMGSGKGFQRFAETLAQSLEDPLKSHHHEIAQFLEAPQVMPLLSEARRLRNWLAHELTVGIERELEIEKERSRIILEVEHAIDVIGRAHLLVLLIFSRQTGEEFSATRYLEEFPHRVAAWVCAVEF